MTIPFTAEFLSHRMREHRRLQDRELERLVDEVMAECADEAAWKRARRETALVLPFPEVSTGLGPQRIARVL